MNKSQKIIPIIILLIIFCTISVSADYNYYKTYGNNNNNQRNILGSAISNYTIIIPPNNVEGSNVESMVYDYDADSINDVIINYPQGLKLYESDSLDVEADSNNIGAPLITPVVCDLNNDGKQEYVSLTSDVPNTTTIGLWTVNNRKLSLLNNIDIGSTADDLPNIDGNVVCSNFYSLHGDNKNYLYYLTNDKRLVKVWMENNVMYSSITDLEHSTNKELVKSIPVISSHNIVLDDSFDINGEKSLSYVAGDYIISLSSDNVSFTYKYYSDIQNLGNIVLYGGAKIRLIGGVNTGSSKKSLLLYSTKPTVLDQYNVNSRNVILEYKMDKTFFIRSIIYQKSTAVGSNGNLEVMVNNQDADNIKALTYNYAQGFSASDVLFTLYASNFSIKYSSSVPVTNGGIWNFNNYMINGDLFFGDQNQNYHRCTKNSNYTICDNIGTTGVGLNVVTPVDINKDGRIDFIMSGLTSTKFLISSINQVIIDQYPFSVEQDNDGFHNSSKASVQRITVGFNDTNNVYNYAVACDMSEFTEWNEQFKLGYNFSQQNVTTNLFPPESNLKYFGLQVTLDNNTSQFDLQKTANIGFNNNMRQKIILSTIGNTTYDYIVYDSTNALTYWLRFNRTDSNIEISKVILEFGTTVSIANVTVSNNVQSINIDYAPTFDSGTGRQYFTTKISINNGTVVDDSTFLFNGIDIKNVEIFTDSIGSSIVITQLGLFKINNPFPDFVLFQNGGIVTDQGVTILSSPPIYSIDGNGFTVFAGGVYQDLTGQQFLNEIQTTLLQFSNGQLDISQTQRNLINFGVNFYNLIPSSLQDFVLATKKTYGGNNVFFSKCQYTNFGTYTQRHYVAPLNTINYVNYKDITVIVSNATVNNTGNNNLADLANTNPVSNFFYNLGIHDTVTAMLVGLGISLAFAIIIIIIMISVFSKYHMQANGVLLICVGILSFVIGLAGTYAVGLTPMWIIIILVLICAALVMLAFRTAVSGS